MSRSGNELRLVVGLGGSAGGLPAFEAIFSRVQADLGIAYIAVQHLDRAAETHLPGILGRICALPVKLIESGMRVDPDQVYVAPAGQRVSLAGATFRLTPPDDRADGLRAIDGLFFSLAEAFGEQAVGVVVSGSGDDGTAGLRRIQLAGGTTLCQRPEEAKVGRMPANAVEAHVVDRVVSAEEIPATLSSLCRAEGNDGAATPELLDEICAVLRRRTGHDFSAYKKTTIARRVDRRIQARGVGVAQDYLMLLANDPAEPQELLQELLISVTRFFRDREAFGALRTEVIPRLFQKASPEEPVRVWVPGCASGEEAYSIAILLREHQQRQELPRPVQVFATDLDRTAVSRARQGRYPAEIGGDIPAEYLSTSFTRTDDGYQINEPLREMCIFSEHNLIKDPPFSRVDLICCRNLFIYWNAKLQGRIIPLFHYALNREGFLFLGPAENVAGTNELFRTVDKKHRLFQRIDGPGVGNLSLPLSSPHPGAPRRVDAIEPARVPGDRDVGRLIVASLLDNHAPPAVVINDRAEIVFVSGRTGRYLEASTGTLTANLFDLVRRPIRPEIHALVHRARHERAAATHPGLAFESDGVVRQVDVTVRPLRELGEPPELYMVVFDERPPLSTGAEIRRESLAASSRDAVVEQLETELRETRENLQSTVEEVRSSNEELLSMNEELQSANEELQTSKEELQSTNEELETVNAELSRKLEELDRANSDLQNFFENTQTPTIFLDAKLQVQKFTPAANTIYRLIPADIGRAISDIAVTLDDGDLANELQGVLRSMRPIEREVWTKDRRSAFIMRVNPYRTVTNVISGVVLTFSDVSELKRAQVQQRQLAAIVEGSNDAIVGRDLNGTITSWNRGAERLYWFTAEEAVGKPSELIMPAEQEEQMAQLVERVRGGQLVAGVETERIRKDGQRIFVSLTVSPIHDEEGRVVAVSVISRDITDQRRIEEMRLRLAAIVESSEDAIVGKNLDAVVTSWNQGAERMFGYTAEEMIGRPIFKIVPPDHPEDVMRILSTIARGEKVKHFETVRVRKDGKRIEVSLTVSPVRDATGRIIGASKIARDITDQKATEAALERGLRLRDEFISLASHELKTPVTAVKLQTDIIKRKLSRREMQALTPERFERFVSQTDAQMARLQHLIDDMLDVSRIEAGRLSLNLEAVDLSALAREVSEQLTEHVSAAGGTLVMELRENVSGTWDRHRLEQVLTNLLTNACRYAPGKPITVRVQSHGDVAELAVTDHGPGIAKQDQQRIFERFERASARGEGGLGIGLYIVREIVAAHGGSVAVESEPGQGATFRVTLPMRGSRGDA